MRFFQDQPDPKRQRPPMTDAGDPPTLTPDNVYLALIAGARTPGNLCQIFDVDVLEGGAFELIDQVLATLMKRTYQGLPMVRWRDGHEVVLLLLGETDRPGDGPFYIY